VATAGELLGFPPTLSLTGDPADLPVAIADHARAALREALSNVVRHAGATTVDVRVDRDASGLRLSVRDNGCGIPADVTRRGLRNIADRAAAVGGRCDVESTPSAGTHVTWWVPA
jgi:signal transduction histidine kinase